MIVVLQRGSLVTRHFMLAMQRFVQRAQGVGLEDLGCGSGHSPSLGMLDDSLFGCQKHFQLQSMPIFMGNMMIHQWIQGYHISDRRARKLLPACCRIKTKACASDSHITRVLKEALLHFRNAAR